MAIDTSIYNNIQPFKQESPFNMLAQFSQIQQAQNQNKLADLKFSEAQRTIDQENALSNAYKDSIGTDGKIDRNKLFSTVAQGGLGSKIPTIQKSLAEARQGFECCAG